MRIMLIILIVFFATNRIQSQKISDYSIAQIDSLLEIFKKEKEHDKLLQYAEMGANKAAKEYGKQDTTYAKMLFQLGDAYRRKQDFGNAEKYLKNAIDIQKTKMPKSLSYANTLGCLASLYKNTGNYTLAEPLFKEVLKIKKEVSGDKHPEYAGGLNNLASLYWNMGNYTLAEPLYKEAIKIWKETLGNKHPDYASSLNNLAVLYMYMRNDALAEPLYIEAMKIRKEVLGNKHPGYAGSLNNLAGLYFNMGNYALAEPFFKEAIEIYKEVLGKKHPSYGGGLNNLAILYQKMGHDSLAEPLYKEALQIRKEVFSDKHPEYIGSLSNLAVLYDEMGKYLLAESLYKEVIATGKEILGEKHPEYIGSLNNLAALYIEMGDYGNASIVIQQAINTNTEQGISLSVSKAWADSLAVANYHSIEGMLITLDCMNALLTKNHSAPSHIAIIADLALQLLQKNRDGFFDEADKLRTLSKSSDWVLRGLAVLDKNTEAKKAFAFAEQNKSVLLLEAAQTAMAYSFGDLPDSLVQKELNLQKKRGEYEAGIIEKRPNNERDSLRVLLNKLNFDIQDFKTTIEKSFPKYAVLKYQHKDASVAEIQTLLDDKTALLEYVVGDSMVYIFYMDNQHLQLVEHRIPKSELTEKIKALHHALSDYEFILRKEAEAYRQYTENAHWFYENLVSVALPTRDLGAGKSNATQNIKNLIIVTDGELGFLPFESFLVKQPPQTVSDYSTLPYLGNAFTISYNYSATLWKAQLLANKDKKNSNHPYPAARRSGQFLAMASNYNIKIDSTKNHLRLPFYQRLRTLLRPLPAAQKEVQMLAQTFNGFFAFDKEASEKNFKEKAGDYAIIHLAMHGLLDNKTPILSSLAFTEDGDSLENNFLHAYEISKMNLNADLVVLSACETGYGRFEKGNGLASLARAFMYAGASAMVVTLWSVNDHSTSIIVQKFYANLADGMPKDKALQEAKIQYMKETKGIFAHPAFWSPFILMGNTDAVVVEKIHAFSVLWAIGISLVALGGIAVVMRNRRKE